MIRHSILAVFVSHSLLLSIICIAQSPHRTEKSRFDDLLARAENGDSDAQLKLADAYLGRAVQTGVKVQPNTSEALRWYLAAAKQNNIEALVELGMGYEYGYFSRPDGNKAVEYYRRAAEFGSTEAVVDLIHLYVEGGKGLTKDFDEAAQWANCPKPSNSAMEQCQSSTTNALPRPALALLQELQCEPDPNDVTVIPLRDASELPFYEVCCHYGPHGPCDAVLIGEVKGRWKNLTDQFGLFGFNETCGGLMILKSTHAGFHDLCLPAQCSKLENRRCQPETLEFDGTRYEPTGAFRKAGAK